MSVLPRQRQRVNMGRQGWYQVSMRWTILLDPWDFTQGSKGVDKVKVMQSQEESMDEQDTFQPTLNSSWL